MDDATWVALTLTLTALGGLYTWFALRRRGFVAGLRGLGFTLLPLALLLTDTLRMVTRIGTAVADWVTHLVFSPVVWAGIVVALVSGVCFVVAGALSTRGIGTSPRARRELAADSPPAAPPARRARSKAPAVDDEMAEIEALLRKRGIS